MKFKHTLTVLSLILLRVLLDLLYINVINPVFNYEGLTISENLSKVIESYLLFISISFLVILKLEDKERPSKIIIYILLVFLYLPITSLFWLQDQPRVYVYCITGSMILMVILNLYIPRINLPFLSEGKKVANLFVIIITLLVYGMLIIQGGLGRINFNLLEVYEVRASYSKTNNFLLGYLLPWQAYGINMLLLAMALHRKKHLQIVAVIFLQLLLFSMTNFKSYLFSPVILLAFYYFSMTKIRNKLLLVISMGSLFLVLLSNLIYKFSSDVMMVSLFIRRQFFVPANLHYIYYGFFESKEKLLLSHSIFSAIIRNPYNSTPVKVVANQYFGKDFSPNVGFFGDSYLNFGLLGIFIFTILLSLILKLLDSVTIYVPTYVAISIIVIPSMALVNSAFFTSLLTHGILFSIFLIWLGNSYFVERK